VPFQNEVALVIELIQISPIEGKGGGLELYVITFSIARERTGTKR
jgi:hypothetical protein